jgi:magnesium-transporting ATPase (P-type)
MLNDERVFIRYDIDSCAIDVKDSLVGDITLLEPSEIHPCDGVSFPVTSIGRNGSCVTGESDAIKKRSATQCCLVALLFLG